MRIAVEIVYALPLAQTLVELNVEAGSTVEQAVTDSGILDQHPELDLASCRLGIWGRSARRSQILKHRDRVEIYRPLTADPKQVRRRQAEVERKRGR